MSWLINDKGMMFGNRINIIDFLVISFLVSLTPMIYFGHKILTNKPAPIVSKPTITIYRAEYEQEQAEHNKLKGERDKLLKEHPRLRKYFSKEQPASEQSIYSKVPILDECLPREDCTTEHKPDGDYWWKLINGKWELYGMKNPQLK